jgi:hypothetical protein
VILKFCNGSQRQIKTPQRGKTHLRRATPYVTKSLLFQSPERALAVAFFSFAVALSWFDNCCSDNIGRCPTLMRIALLGRKYFLQNVNGYKYSKFDKGTSQSFSVSSMDKNKKIDSYRKRLQYLPAFELPNGNAAFGERRLPEITS